MGAPVGGRSGTIGGYEVSGSLASYVVSPGSGDVRDRQNVAAVFHAPTLSPPWVTRLHPPGVRSRLAPPVPLVRHIPADGPPLISGADALRLIYDEGAGEADWIAVPAARLDPAFFTLSSGIAGEFVQKFANYGQRLAVVGDISGPLGESAALRDFVRESNRGRQVWFVADAAELERRLST